MKMICSLLCNIILIFVVSMFSGCGSSSQGGYDSAVGWAVGGSVDGYGTILHTRDGGNIWSREGVGQIPDTDLSEVVAIDTGIAWTVGRNSDGYGTILRTNDGGTTWVRQGSPAMIPDVELSDIRQVNGDVAWVVGDRGVILHTIDGGKTWSRQGEGQVPDAAINYVASVDELNAWITGVDEILGYAFIYRTYDGGKSWVRQDPENTYLKTSCAIDMYALDASNAWIVGTNSIVLYTKDGGKNWENISWQIGGIAHANGVCAFDAKTIWVAADYNVMHFTSTGGEGATPWKDMNLASWDNADFWLLRVTGYTPQVIWVTGANPRGMTPKGGILHTRDGGTTWTNQILPVDINLRGISFVGARR